MYRIFIVEDDPVIARVTARQLAGWGYTVTCAQNFERVMAEFAACDPQLVLMDIMLPFYNGHHWCSEIRKVSKVPILFLSSASDNMNIVMAMNMGGDDFIAKPFDMSVLVAKVQALLRRTYDFGMPAQLLECGGATLNLSDATLRMGDTAVELTKNECRILQMLLENKGHVVTRSALMTRLWESDDYIDENTLTVNVTRLRRKLEQIGVADCIHTKKGEGYLVQ
jgi:two-component system response regulator protein BraR/BceR